MPSTLGPQRSSDLTCVPLPTSHPTGPAGAEGTKHPCLRGLPHPLSTRVQTVRPGVRPFPDASPPKSACLEDGPPAPTPSLSPTLPPRQTSPKGVLLSRLAFHQIPTLPRGRWKRVIGSDPRLAVGSEALPWALGAARRPWREISDCSPRPDCTPLSPRSGPWCTESCWQRFCINCLG